MKNHRLLRRAAATATAKQPANAFRNSAHQ
jgi:hypothetical protein